MLNVVFPLQTTFIDYPDDESEAIIIYILGCDHFCVGCQNPLFKNKDYNLNTKLLYPIELLLEIEKLSKRIDSNKVVLSGGDPLSKTNIEDVKSLLNFNITKKFDYMIYTGYDIEYVKTNFINGFKFIKCGNYLPEYKQDSEKTDDYLKFASTNQKLFDENFNLISNNGIFYFNK
ncbi:MAG TPA: 4Fe-4S cluster-binding domain-containing protein [Caldisericia bacterium]|jgi:organic radical activating enzyme|nr:4Fe-4S cluster-binding domain-containing protein [Caldisericia bacterium]